MSAIAKLFKEGWLAFWILALGFAPMPMVNTASSLAAAPIIRPTPVQTGTDRLQKVWEREQTIYNQLGPILSNIDQRIARWQDLINKAKSSGKDISTLQTALVYFSAAVKQAGPIFQSTQVIVSSHAGFDGNGIVIDRVQALATVKDLGDKFKKFHQLLSGPRSSLLQAFKDFRQANTPTPQPTPDQSGS